MKKEITTTASSVLDTLTEKLTNIQSRLNAPKSKRNNFGNYNYRSCEDILEAVKPLLKENGCVITINDEIVAVGNRIYVRATATISDGKDAISTTAYAREEETKKGMDAAQVTGSSSSYARKYALNGLLAIDDNKDPDATNTHGKESNANRVAEAMSYLDKAQSRDQVVGIWNFYRDLQTIPEFKNKVAELGNNLKQKENESK